MWNGMAVWPNIIDRSHVWFQNYKLKNLRSERNNHRQMSMLKSPDAWILGKLSRWLDRCPLASLERSSIARIKLEWHHLAELMEDASFQILQPLGNLAKTNDLNLERLTNWPSILFWITFRDLCRLIVSRYYWEPFCFIGMLGCLADGLNPECRFCGSGDFAEAWQQPNRPNFSQRNEWPRVKSGQTGWSQDIVCKSTTTTTTTTSTTTTQGRIRVVQLILFLADGELPGPCDALTGVLKSCSDDGCTVLAGGMLSRTGGHGTDQIL